jgi:hypothetical protein
MCGQRGDDAAEDEKPNEELPETFEELLSVPPRETHGFRVRLLAVQFDFGHDRLLDPPAVYVTAKPMRGGQLA